MITNYVYQRLKMLKFLKLNDILRSYSVLGQNWGSGSKQITANSATVSW